MIKYSKIISAALLSCVSASVFCGCGGAAQPADVTSAPQTTASVTSEMTTASGTSAVSADTSAETAVSEIPDTRAEMLARSVLSPGNTSRLRSVIEKMRNGEAVTFAYIGGSITEGAGAPTKADCWAALSFKRITEKYGASPSGSVYINAGVSGTPSVLGDLRLKRDVLDKTPDVVFVEFAVNDSMDDLCRKSYESLVKTTLMQENRPAVILVFTRLEGGYSCQPQMSDIGYAYDLPMISVNDAVTAEISAGRLQWSDYSKDYAHPVGEWHSNIADMVCELFREADENGSDAPYTLPEKDVFGTPYENAVMMTPSYNTEQDNIIINDMGDFDESPVSGTGSFRGSWHCSGSCEAPMSLTVKGSSFSVIYRRDKRADMGSVDVFFNGTKTKTINSHDDGGWGDPVACQVIEFSEPREMDIEILPSEGSEEKNFYILAFGTAGGGSE